LSWNWSIWKNHFSTYVPILDFIHAIQYVFAAAQAATSDEPAAWEAYVGWVARCWKGWVDEVIAELGDACRQRGLDVPDRVADDDPAKPLADALRYLTNNRDRMDYPYVRRAYTGYYPERPVQAATKPIADLATIALGGGRVRLSWTAPPGEPVRYQVKWADKPMVERLAWLEEQDMKANWRAAATVSRS
jgi:hypothetical protein